MTVELEQKTDTTLYIIERLDKNARLTCTIGKITVSMKKDLDKDILAKILLSLSKVDSNIAYEYETMCQYNDINRLRLDDYVVVSYSKSGPSAYKTIFSVPFSRRKALRRLAINVSDRLMAGDADLSILWDGNPSKISQLSEELQGDWKMQVIEANKES
ncbi:conserved hypothetical protein [Methanocella paludicola SANAE]|uniref:Uncharacterized protein n=1 Tax=Methanocella paludicola (strain DSM 17711 / JCM 13418 / NBRC 101707 / SANAE) TaxID=304371 RepID=D1YZM0_METPS|nr:hypothetical protein [Methanocella paludicola]BAI61892.1 conserved hypothetical protein [Methanocella paludicola SANAE]